MISNIEHINHDGDTEIHLTDYLFTYLHVFFTMGVFLILIAYPIRINIIFYLIYTIIVAYVTIASMVMIYFIRERHLFFKITIVVWIFNILLVAIFYYTSCVYQKLQ